MQALMLMCECLLIACVQERRRTPRAKPCAALAARLSRKPEHQTAVYADLFTVHGAATMRSTRRSGAGAAPPLKNVRFAGNHAHDALLVVEGSTGVAATPGACASARAVVLRGLRARRLRRARVPTCGVGLPEQCRERFERRHWRGTARLHARDRVRLAARRHRVRLKR